METKQKAEAEGEGGGGGTKRDPRRRGEKERASVWALIVCASAYNEAC